ncbi:MAG: peptide deformylase [Firmicutes bacterium]|nr:peptide deformylase [Bacillota bacterium]
MAIRNIRKQPDPVLREKTAFVSRFNAPLHRLLDDMAETMLDVEGAGLAAPQVGISKKIIVVRDGDGIVEIINPEITYSEGESIGIEGCLSIPGIYGEVPRFARVTVKGLDRSGRKLEIFGEEFLARVLQHEIDHLQGILFIDKALRLLTPEEIKNLSKKS